MTRLFHGGISGLRPGDLIKPEPHAPGWKRDDCKWCQSGADDSHMPDRVFVTTHKLYAKYYASRFGRGDVYVVEPVGDLEQSDADHFECYAVSSAHVISVYDRAVLLTMGERRRLFREWGGTNYEFNRMVDAVVLQ